MWGFLGVQRIVISVIMPWIAKDPVVLIVESPQFPGKSFEIGKALKERDATLPDGSTVMLKGAKVADRAVILQDGRELPIVESRKTGGLGISYTMQGWIVAITALIWAFGTVVWATIGDRLGRRPVIIGCTVLSALFSWVTGFVHSLAQLLMIRGFLGLFEGGPYAPAIGTLSEEVPENQRAMNAGLVTGSFMLVGVCFGSQLAVLLLNKFGSWRPVFYVVSTPALLIGIITYFVMREAPSIAESLRLRKAGEIVEKKDAVKVLDALKYKNVVISCCNSIPVMGWLYVYTLFSSSYLLKVHQFGAIAIGLIVSASGLGGFLGEFIMGLVSDHVGRKKALITSALLCTGFGILVVLLPKGTSPELFGAIFFFYGLFGAGMYPMYLGTLPVESVPPKIAGTAVAIPVAVGETLGAALVPLMGGVLGDVIGIKAPMWIAAFCGIVIAIISLFYTETAPRCVAKLKNKPTTDDYLLKAFRRPEQPLVMEAEK